MTHQRRRIYAVDVARGFCLVIMTVDHVPSSILGRFSNYVFGPFGFFTAASGFVFLSGLVSAWAYGPVYREQGPAAAWRRALQRAAQVYAVNTSLFLLILAGISLNILTAPSWRHEFPPFFSEPWTAMCKGLLLSYRPGYLDILPMYVLFLLITTPVLAAVQRSHAWMVLGLSVLVWGWVQMAAPESNNLNAFGYQILFVSGLVLGCQPDMDAKLRSIKAIRLGQASLILASCLLFVRLALGLLGSPGLDIPGWHRLTHLEHNGPLRVANFALFAFSLAYLWPRIPTRIKSTPLLRWLAYLGQHSLQVFAWSVLLTYASIALMPQNPSRLWSVIDILLTVSSLIVPAATHAWLTRRSRGRSLEPGGRPA